MGMAETARFLDSFETVQKYVHKWAIGKGFWDEDEKKLGGRDQTEAGGFTELTVKTKPINVAEKLMLIVTEVSEALEDDRNPKPKDMQGAEFKQNEVQWWTKDGAVYREPSEYYPVGKVEPKGFPIELADIVIRVMDLAEHFEIDLARCILAKMEYNHTRSHKHGKAY